MDCQEFFDALRRRADADSSVIATLRRSQAFEPGAFAPAFPLIESHTHGLSEASRQTVYLAAGLWATAVRRESGPGLSLPEAMARLQRDTGSKSIEARFVSLLDADPDELVWRLRHVVALAASAGLALSWPDLLQDLLNWRSPHRYVQQRWARQFWQPAASHESTAPASENA